ncbi:MAG: four helix bundle protein [Gracilimonas sp.]|uniref:four helix bundle protein n=1 Tax=Gracilimonas TaxID=649462 RepID=UPI001B0C09CA|nr:four helix bundle protein [Gracilimonas sp.]MBO6586705.1 four helix bundle protein [Gracilimonas sp.]MBO6615362.1 four helix bundle protein [Gracilimonas sp.]
MAFKFEKLEVWQLAVDLADEIYLLIEALPDTEKFNLTSQIQRAVTSVSLNIAEGSTGQTDPEQSRFIGYAHRSLMEVVACLILMKKRAYISTELFEKLYQDSEKLSAKLLAMKKYLKKGLQSNEPGKSYEIE